MKKVVWVGVDGRGGSGKTTLADFVSRQLAAQIIHTDDFSGWENPSNWWPLVIERVFDPVANGATTLSYPCAKWWQDHHPEPVVDQPVTPVMVVEGVSALRAEFRPYLTYGIFVDTPAQVCIERGFQRDRGMDGKSDDEIRAMWRGWCADEDQYLKRNRPQEFADVVVSGTQDYLQQPALMELIARLKRDTTREE